MVRTAAIYAAAWATGARAAQFVMYTPGGDSDLVERMDAIVSPGRISAHTHQIFGANNASPNMTYDALQTSDCTTVGNAAGDGNGADKSVYWHPSLYAEAADGSGYVRIPSGGHKLYYRDVGNTADKRAKPFEFPKGFHMVAGDQTLRVANRNEQHQKIVEWICHTSAGQNDGVDNKSGFPADVQNCDSFPGFVGSIHFPHCWNGEAAKPNDNSHMAYPDGDVQGGPCPSSHPTRVPHIFMENFFDLAKVHDQIKPNTFVTSQGDPTGYGFHADFFNGWDEGAIPDLYQSCPQPFYGNSDVGTCPAFKKFSTKNTACSLPVTFKEEHNAPGKYLPGCNPITTTNPAPKMKAAGLGVCSNECTPLGATHVDEDENDDETSGSSAAPPSYGESSNSASPTTLAKAYTTPAAVADPADGEAVAYVTEHVTVTASMYNKRDAAPTPESNARHEHLRHHRRHGHKL